MLDAVREQSGANGSGSQCAQSHGPDCPSPDCRSAAAVRSGSALLAAALRYCREQATPKRVVSFVCDTGTRYLSKVDNDQWMLDQGLLARRVPLVAQNCFGDARRDDSDAELARLVAFDNRDVGVADGALDALAELVMPYW